MRYLDPVENRSRYCWRANAHRRRFTGSPGNIGYPIAGNSAAFESFTRLAVSKTEETIAPLSLLNHAQDECAIVRLWSNQSA